MAVECRHKFLTKAQHRSQKDKRHVGEVCRLNKKMNYIELIKERLHNFFEATDAVAGSSILAFFNIEKTGMADLGWSA